jgi:mono/diheme cytochrome c family protein
MKSTLFRGGFFIALLALVAVVLVAPRINAQGTPVASTPSAVEPGILEEGEAIVSSICLACHQPGAKGIEGVYPALANSAFVTLDDPTIVISTVLNGRGGMPRFAGNFSDDQVAAILTYLRQSFGNNASPVTPEQVAEVRASTSTLPESTATEEPEPTTAPSDEPEITF